MKKYNTWKVISVADDKVAIREDEDFETGLSYNDARAMAKDCNRANHHGQIFKAVKEDK